MQFASRASVVHWASSARENQPFIRDLWAQQPSDLLQFNGAASSNKYFLELPSIKNTGKCLWKILEPPDSFAPSIPNKGSAWEGIVTGMMTAGFQWWPCFRTTWLGWTFPEMRANVEIHAILPQISFTFSFRLQEQDWNSVRTFCSI